MKPYKGQPRRLRCTAFGRHSPTPASGRPGAGTCHLSGRDSAGPHCPCTRAQRRLRSCPATRARAWSSRILLDVQRRGARAVLRWPRRCHSGRHFRQDGLRRSCLFRGENSTVTLTSKGPGEGGAGTSMTCRTSSGLPNSVIWMARTWTPRERRQQIQHRLTCFCLLQYHAHCRSSRTPLTCKNCIPAARLRSQEAALRLSRPAAPCRALPQLTEVK